MISEELNSGRYPAVVIELEEIDVSVSAELFECYGERIPVLGSTIDNVEIGWPFERHALTNFLNNYIQQLDHEQ